MQPRHISMVVFPEPEGPRTAETSPSCNIILASARATTSVSPEP